MIDELERSKEKFRPLDEPIWYVPRLVHLIHMLTYPPEVPRPGSNVRSPLVVFKSSERGF